MCRDIGAQALSVEKLSESHVWSARIDKNKFSRDECGELIRMGALPTGTMLDGKEMKPDALKSLRAWICVHAKLLAVALADASLLTSPQVERTLTPDEITAARAAFPGVDITAVATRIANSWCARQREEQIVDASVCVGGIAFLERCVNCAARLVAAMARAPK